MGAFRIAVVAPGGRILPETADKAMAFLQTVYPSGRVEIHFSPQCLASSGHFAGDDEERATAFVEAANDPAIDAVWFARGGYGAARMAELALPRLGPAAGAKTYLGYSDIGALLGALYAKGIGRQAHGPMLGDIVREGGEAALARGLRWLVEGDETGLEPADDGAPRLAYNIAVLSSVLGTSLEPPFDGHLLMLEEVGEYMYRIDRYLYHITSQASVRRARGIRLGRFAATIANKPEFGAREEEVMTYWCERAGIPYLGRADIGHDSDNKIAPFGRFGA